MIWHVFDARLGSMEIGCQHSTYDYSTDQMIDIEDPSVEESIIIPLIS